MTTIEKIKAEIDRLYGEYKDKFHQCGDQYHLGLIDGLDMAERVLDSLESEKPMNPTLQEQPVSEDLEEAKKIYIAGLVLNGKCPDATVKQLKEVAGDAYIAGANWQKEQMMKEARK